MTDQKVSKEIRYTVPCKGILGLKTNIRDFRWSFGQNVPEASLDEYNNCVVQLTFMVEPTNRFSEVRQGKYHYFTAEPNEQSVFYRRPFLLGSEICLKALDLTGQNPQIWMNKTYYRFVHFRFMNLHSANFVMTDVATLLLLKKQLAPIHCSAFKTGDRTVILFAPSNTGKTLSTMTACIELGADFVAEDLAISDGQSVFSLPWTSTFRYYGKVDARLLARLRRKVMRALPMVDLLPTNDKSITDYLPMERICHSSAVTHLVILERGPKQVESVDRQTAFQKIQNLNRAEFNYQRGLINNAYEYFNPTLDIIAAYETEKALLYHLVNNVQDCLIVRNDDPVDYASLVLHAVGA